MADPTIESNDEVDAGEVGRNNKPETNRVSAGKVDDSYDKAVLILSGSALGLSLVVIQDYLRLRGGGAGLIALALLSWALSVSCILFSWKAIGAHLRQMGGGTALMTLAETSSNRMVQALSTGSGVLFLLGVVFFAVYVALEPRASAKQQQAPAAGEEITRVLALYDTIREVCPECSAAEARKVLQACEGSYVVPEVLHEACPHCTERGILQLDRRCMEKWNKPR
jgi:hypothetical protein